MKFPVFFYDSGILKCPTCRCEYAPINSACKSTIFEPKKVIAKIHFTDSLNRNPVYPITDMRDFYCLIPNKFQNNKACEYLNPFTDELEELPSPMACIMMNIIGGLEHGDTDFYMRRLPKTPVDIEYKDLLSDIIITSKWSEDLNSDLITLKPFDVMDLNDYYNSNS